MKPEEIKNEFRSLAAELKNAVISENKEAIAKINERMDTLEETKTSVDSLGEKFTSLELEMKKRPQHESKADTSKLAKKEFENAFRSFAKGEIEDLRGKSYVNVPSEQKSENMVRFDFASAGALLVPPSFGAELIRDAVEATPVMDLVRTTTINTTEHKRRRRKGLPGGRWLGEEQENEKGKIEFDIKSLSPYEWAALYGVTHQQLRDSAVDLANEIQIAFRDDFSVDIGNAVVRGDGIGKPTGMVGNILNFDATQLALSIDDLVRMQEELKEPYHNNASWLITRKTRAYIRTKILAAGNDLNGAWEPDLTRRTPTQLLGAPVFIAAEGDLAGRSSGNFTGGQVYAIYGDFAQGYEAVMREDMFMIDDPYTDSKQFVRNFHILTSVGGGVVQPEALVQITAAGS